MIRVSIEDTNDVRYLVRELDYFEQNQAVKSGLRAAVGIFRVQGRKNLRSRLLRHGRQTNHLYNAFTTRVKRSKLGALAGFDRPGGNHAHLVDRGTKPRITRKGYSRGIMPGNRFWSDTQAENEDRAMDAVMDGIRNAVERIQNRRRA